MAVVAPTLDLSVLEDSAGVCGTGDYSDERANGIIWRVVYSGTFYGVVYGYDARLGTVYGHCFGLCLVVDDGALIIVAI